jgi:hypothetical protein
MMVSTTDLSRPSFCEATEKTIERGRPNTLTDGSTQSPSERFDHSKLVRPDHAAKHTLRLVCRSSSPLTMSQSEDTIVFGEFRNLLSGRPMGASQVTPVVERGTEFSACGAS